MSLKGVCSIELRDSDGNIVQKTEDENMVTNYLSNLVNPNLDTLKTVFNMAASADFECAYFPLVDKVIGGVLLFGETLEEDVDYKIPAASLVGHASSIYNYNIPTRGIYNGTESSVITDENGKKKGFKYVWDFATDKANGTIKCISLTTGCIGDKGVKINKNNAFYDGIIYNPVKPNSSTSAFCNSYPFNVFKTSTGENLYNSSSVSENGQYVYYGKSAAGKTYNGIDVYKEMLLCSFKKGDYIYVSQVSESNITFAHYKTKRSLGLYDNRVDIKSKMQKGIEKQITFDKKIFSGQGNTISAKSFASKIFTDDTHIYISGVEKNNLYWYKIEQDTFTVVDEKQLPINIEGIQYRASYEREQGCVYFEGKIYATRYWNSNDGTENRYRLDVIAIHEDDPNIFDTICTIYKERTLSNSGYAVLYSIFDNALFITTVHKSIMIKNGKIVNEFIGWVPITFKDLEFPYCYAKQVDYSNVSYENGVCAHGLITIDNLSTPIIKNSTQTMKITYEITEVDETV